MTGPEQAEQLALLLSLQRELALETDIDVVLRRIAEFAIALLDAERATVYVVDRERSEVWSRILTESELREIRLPLDGRGLASEVARGGDVLRIDDPYGDPRFDASVDARTGYRTRSMLVAPIDARDRTRLGVLQIVNKKGDGPFAKADEDVTRSLASSAGIALEYVLLNAQLAQERLRVVKVTEETQYPFGETITLKVSTGQPVTFPLYVRVPQWCRGYDLWYGGGPAETESGDGYNRVEREWKDGDTLTVRLPMQVKVRRWPGNSNSISVDRGPITYSLAIGEKWERYGGSEQWPEWQVTPTSAWNYGLVVNEKDPAKSFEVVKKQWGDGNRPVNPLNRYDVELKAKAKKIPNWTADAKGVVGALQPSPVKSDEPVETVTLISGPAI